MSKNKFLVLLLVAASFLAGILLFSFSPSVETFAQRLLRSTTQFENNWQYCAITRVRVINPPPDRLDVYTGEVKVIYFNYTYNRITVKESFESTDFFTHELSYAEFLQENNLKANATSQQYAGARAADLALAKAMNKLGASGWEIIGRSFSNFGFETSDGMSEYKNALYFKKLAAQKQTTNQQ